MHVLITAGNTATPIDRVRVITNVFRGRTGARIAAGFAAAGHRVRLLTSTPESAAADGGFNEGDPRITVEPYRTFDDLQSAMQAALSGDGPDRFDALVHSAAVSDYLVGGVFARAADGTMTDVSAGKVKSDEPELWLRLVRAPKLVDLVRPAWGFRGVVVKFKLEVGVGEAGLLEIAERSRRHSDADLMVANTLEGAGQCAYVGPGADGGYERVRRDDLPARLVAAVGAAVDARRG